MSINKTTGANANPIGSSIDPDFHVPSCTIEDVDRALFNLFDKDMELFYKQKENLKRVPIIFATGERFAILRRKKPLRDKNGAIILPLISISRTGVEKDVARGMGTNQSGEIVIKKKLSAKDPVYQRLINKERLENQDDRATEGHYISNLLSGNTKDGLGAMPGTVARRGSDLEPNADFKNGRLISSALGNNIYEIYTLPAPRYYVASYEITIWAQYTQQMNNFITSIMSSGHTNGVETFRIETDKGYWFVAYLTSALTPGNNFSDFTSDERIVRYSFSMEVPGYIINPLYPGSEPTHRRYYSATQINFDMSQVGAIPQEILIGGPKSGKPDDYILQDLKTADDPAVSNTIGGHGVVAPADFYETTAVGGSQSGRNPLTVQRVYTDSETGQTVRQNLRIVGRNQRKGETVYREQITFDLGDIVITPK
tara:strand:+ start:1898 stop:3178 length:1281 start_codon:yes stop_codon:yes gene_type:complete